MFFNEYKASHDPSRGYSSARLPVVMRSVLNYTTLFLIFISTVTGYEQCSDFYPASNTCNWPTNYIRCCDELYTRKFAYCGPSRTSPILKFRRGRCPENAFCIRHPRSPSYSDFCGVSPLDSNYLYLGIQPPNPHPPPQLPQPVRFFYFQGLTFSWVWPVQAL